MSTRTLAVVSAGLSTPSSTRLLADRLTAAAVEELRGRGVQTAVEVVELREHARELADNLLTGFPAENLRRAVDAVSGADGLIVVTPVFAASYSGLFKTFTDVLDPEALAGKPVLLAATGGTARHSLALEHAMRPLFSYLRALTVPTAVFAASQDWAGGSEAGGDRSVPPLSARVARAAGELAELVQARPAQAPVDPFDDPTPFDQLLRGL